MSAQTAPDISAATPAFTVIGAQITAADVTKDQINILLTPATPDLSGTLTLQLISANGNDTILNAATRSGGPHTESFDIPNLAANEYTQLQAVWTVGTVGTSSATSIFSYHIQVLGVYRHSQYNTPNESGCAATPTEQVYFTNSACNFSLSSDTLRTAFVSQAYINGDGISIAHGVLHYDTTCLASGSAPANASGISFRPVSAPVAGCSNRQLIGGQTVAVAVNQLGTLPCGTQIYIDTVGVKTVTDSCPACNDGSHIDDYTNNPACSPGSIPDLGNFMTIKLF
ncbi:MAG: hypothetical protein HKL90_01890 [Elusimicrobia bacterium]|nr:hypothetical protein [Elusimicrobiota bacterium]